MTPSLTLSTVLGLLALSSLPLAPQAAAFEPAARAQDARPERYVRTASSAKVLNLADEKGLPIGEFPAGTLLAVHGERAGWLSVEPPQGLTVWVYGEFLRATSSPGVAEVRGDGVRMRPKPASTKDSFPLEQQLHNGDRVRVLGRNDPAKAANEDWVRVMTPPGVRGWIRAADTKPLESGVDARSAWMDAVKVSVASLALVDLKSGASAGTPAAAPAAAAAPKADSASAQGAWEAAERAYESAKVAPVADWAAVRAQFQRYLDSNPSGAQAGTAKLRLEQIGYHEEIARLKSAAAMQESQRQKLLREAQAQLEEASLAQDPLWGRFQARGWLRRDESVPGRYVLQWAGRTAAEVTCGSGRYDLKLYEGAEIGIQGALTRAAGSVDRPMRIDATRIEVISAPTGR
ncbi:MAG: hypothetical protein JNK02_16385 [Planctomycetes bacterium]|nr:hypothetical protein [Planctomycetota bacterium]